MKKKLISVFLGFAMVLGLAGCNSEQPSSSPNGNNSTQDVLSEKNDSAPSENSTVVSIDSGSENPSDSSDVPTSNNGKVLVVYFSVPDDKDNSYVVKNGEQLGNTQYMAYVIAENTDADIFRIEPETPYPTNHDELLEVAQQEIRDKARPAIKEEVANFDSYETVFVGYPNWNADMPYILYTFFETYDFSGKTIVPFNTHGGSGFSGTQETIAELEPNATMLEGKSISRNSIEDAEQEIIDWVKSLGI